MRCDILAVGGLVKLLDALLQIKLTVLQVTGITRAEVAVFGESLCIQSVALVVAACNRRTLQQNLIVLSDLDVQTVNRTSHRTDGERLSLMVVAHRGETLRQTVAHHHIDADAVDKLLHLRRHIGTCRREEVRILQAQLLAHQREHRLVHHLIFHCQSERRTLATAQVFNVVFMTYGKGMLEKLTLRGTGIFNLRLHADIHLFPETGHATHTRGIRLAQ